MEFGTKQVSTKGPYWWNGMCGVTLLPTVYACMCGVTFSDSACIMSNIFRESWVCIMPCSLMYSSAHVI